MGVQLVSLNVWNSSCDQITYVLQTIFPNGLPALRSLAVAMSSSSIHITVPHESALWYEMTDGRLCEAESFWDQIKARDVNSLCIGSILQAAPNLEEIAFHSRNFPFVSPTSC